MPKKISTNALRKFYGTTRYKNVCGALTALTLLVSSLSVPFVRAEGTSANTTTAPEAA